MARPTDVGRMARASEDEGLSVGPNDLLDRAFPPLVLPTRPPDLVTAWADVVNRECVLGTAGSEPTGSRIPHVQQPQPTLVERPLYVAKGCVTPCDGASQRPSVVCVDGRSASASGQGWCASRRRRRPRTAGSYLLGPGAGPQREKPGSKPRRDTVGWMSTRTPDWVTTLDGRRPSGVRAAEIRLVVPRGENPHLSPKRGCSSRAPCTAPPPCG